MVAEFEADLIRLRTREGIGIARSKGKLKGKKPKLSPSQRKHLLTLHTAGEHTQAELAELFNVSRITISRVALHHGRHLRSEEHTSELQSRGHLVCRLLLEKKKHQT